MTYDAAAWGACACALSALGAVLTWQAFRKRGLASGVRGLAWTLVPIAAWLTGLLRLAANVLGDIGDWFARLVFSPTVWLGIIVAGVAVVLFGTSAVLGHRGGRKGGKTKGTGEISGKGRPGISAGDTGLESMDDIEAILKKHGIQ